jgi:uncharacterized protein
LAAHKNLAIQPRMVAQLCLTFLIAGAGMVLAQWVHLPGGPLVGALLVTSAARLLNAPLEAPRNWMKALGRILIGLGLGAKITPETLQTIARALVPMLVMIAAVILLGLLMAQLIHRYTRMPMPTALCSSAPGGLAAMVALADDLSNEGPVVASMHVVRLVSVMLVVPTFVRGVFPDYGLGVGMAASASVVTPDALLRTTLLLALGLAVGWAAERYKLPTGGLLAGMIVAGVLNPLWLQLPKLPGWWQLVAQLIIGAGVGATMTRETLRNFKPYVVAGVLMTVFLILFGLGLGWIMAQVTDLDLVTAIAACAPGGADTMVILANNLGADAQVVAAMHVMRIVLIMLLLPVLIRRKAAVPELCREPALPHVGGQ